jgi:hypothetical protein
MEGQDSKSTSRRELDWQFCQVFGEPHFEEVTEVDIVSTVEFDSTGEYLAAGDRGGRVVIFQRVEVRGATTQARISNSSAALSHSPFVCFSFSLPFFHLWRPPPPTLDFAMGLSPIYAFYVLAALRGYSAPPCMTYLFF